MSPSVVYVMCRSESMTHRDIVPVNPFITFKKRVELNIFKEGETILSQSKLIIIGGGTGNKSGGRISFLSQYLRKKT